MGRKPRKDLPPLGLVSTPASEGGESSVTVQAYGDGTMIHEGELDLDDPGQM